MSGRGVIVVSVRWHDGYMERFEAEEVRAGRDLLWLRQASGSERNIPLRSVRWFSRSGTEDALSVIGRIAHYLEEDEPYKAQRIATGGAPLDRPANSATPPFEYPTDLPNPNLGVTAGLRLYCVLLAEGRP